ncbi:PTS sugar transporter subunit IIA [Alkalicoccobacillus murimartini]|uniref:PTS system galactitol-specific IIA component n=1 Tax=Alkalicoccobacillus murimartini TaxID=171685 RepID=A0ABT9YIN1_9BACI|nr:PTS sugar transporter subunit IIA [Alkalicoccobacillus murimartini]MDQ0207713.1 PTS system galactitol-specific IIA component [Alkalicoccobacillus murimartini]
MTTLLINDSLILHDIQASSKEDALRQMAGNMLEQGVVKESYIDAIIERENNYATGLPTKGVAVAIPHTDREHVLQKSLSVGVLKEPVDFVIMGESEQTVPVKLIFMLAMDENHAQLSLLQKLMGIFQDEERLLYLARETDKQKLIDTLQSSLDLTLKGGEKT